MKYNDQGFYDNDSDEFSTEEFNNGLEPPFEPAYEPPYKKQMNQSFEPDYGQSFEQPFEPSIEQPFGQSMEQSFEQPFDQSFEQPFQAETESEVDWEERRETERRRAAARRRKMEARERRRRKRMIQAITRCSILLIIVIMIIVGIVKMISGTWKHFHKDKKPDKKTEQMVSTEETTEAPAPKIDKKILAKKLPADKEAALAILKELAEEDPDIKSIYDNAAVYSDKILKHLAANSEMTEFVLNYPAKIVVVYDGAFELEIPEKKVPLYLQYDEQWGYADYGNELIATNGSAPTCLSMAYTYLKKDGTKNPIKVADYAVSKGYLSEEGVTSEKLMKEGATELGLTSAEIPLDKKKMQAALKEGKLIVCKMKDGDFTKDVQYILIYKCKDGLFYLNDPSSAARSDVPWAYDRLSDQIDKMWVLSK